MIQLRILTNKMLALINFFHLFSFTSLVIFFVAMEDNFTSVFAFYCRKVP